MNRMHGMFELRGRFHECGLHLSSTITTEQAGTAATWPSLRCALRANTKFTCSPASLRVSAIRTFHFHYIPSLRFNTLAAVLTFIIPATLRLFGGFDIIHSQGLCGLRQKCRHIARYMPGGLVCRSCKGTWVRLRSSSGFSRASFCPWNGTFSKRNIRGPRSRFQNT